MDTAATPYPDAPDVLSLPAPIRLEDTVESRSAEHMPDPEMGLDVAHEYMIRFA